LLAALPCAAQQAPDPGRRLSPEEMKRLEAEGERGPYVQEPQQPDLKPRPVPKDPQVCDRARTNYMLMCGARDSPRSRTRECIEANDIYVRAC
jgi:hypothetical protein